MKLFPAILTSVALATALPAMAAPEAGDRSFTISGTGASDKDLNGNAFGVSFEVGKYADERVLYGIRQSINGLAGDEVDDSWNGSTRLFVDYHFGNGELRPFLGANIGGVYGESVKETGAAGLEAGFKYFVKEKTYVSFGAEYQFLFDDGDEIDQRFNNGAFFYTMGVGFNF